MTTPARHEHIVMVQPRRGVGQDRAAVVPCRGGVVVVVVDGAGGAAGGTEAADLVLERVREAPPLTSTACVELLAGLDDDIRRHPRAGETTAVIAHVDGSRISGASVGDSVAWAIDHRAARDLTARQHRKPLVGHGNAIPVPFDAPLGACTLLVATDGLHAYAPTAAIVEAAGRAALDDAVRKLIALPRLLSGEIPDDIAVVLVRICRGHGPVLTSVEVTPRPPARGGGRGDDDGASDRHQGDSRRSFEHVERSPTEMDFELGQHQPLQQSQAARKSPRPAPGPSSC